MQSLKTVPVSPTDGSVFRLAIVHLVCPEYKVPMFQAIARLSRVQLRLFLGDKPPNSQPSGMAWVPVEHVKLHNRIIRLFGLEVVWQPLGHTLKPKDYDLVLLPDGLLYLANYLIMFKCWWQKVAVGFYTHGYNHQRKGSRLSAILERLRGVIHRHSDVLVVYAPDGAHHLLEVNRVPPERVFIARNTLDVERIQSVARGVTERDIESLREHLGVLSQDVLVVYPGRLVPIKNPEWVIETVASLRRDGIPVRAVFVGDGESLPQLHRRVDELPQGTRDAIRFAGHVSVDEVSRYLLAGDITVMPGMTGLAVVHSFALGKPYVTVAGAAHSPEICYVKHGVNGLIAPETPEGFAEAVRYLVVHPDVRRAMGEAALSFASTELTLGHQLRGFEQAIAFVRSRSALRSSAVG